MSAAKQSNISTQTHGRAHLDARRPLGLAATTDGRFTAPVGGRQDAAPAGQLITCPNFNCRTVYHPSRAAGIAPWLGCPNCLNPIGGPR